MEEARCHRMGRGVLAADQGVGGCGCCSEREKRPMIYKWVELVGTGAGGAFLILAVVYQSTQVGRRRRRRVHTTNTSMRHPSLARRRRSSGTR